MKIRTIIYQLLMTVQFAHAWAEQTPVAGPASLVARATANPSPATAQGPIGLTIEVTNGGPNAAFSVAVTNRLPKGVAFVRSDPAGFVIEGGQEGEEVVVELGKVPV